MNVLKNSIVSAGDGRGFVVNNNLIITAVHCLPWIPSGFTIGGDEGKIYPDIVGNVFGSDKYWAECLFADVVSDVAVLTNVDGQDYYEESLRHEDWVEKLAPLAIKSASGKFTASFLTLDRQVEHVNAECLGARLTLSAIRVEAGVSGSPIVNEAGAAVGVLCTTALAPQPVLTQCLPGYLLTEIL